ncbi:unnamed protein product [Polarella glacialis]|uniref:Uncharacterized protein n=1 Tax=Polarella glacialis TaxID=89957 RepID=A0A813E9L8_POLGL|nr:unnamed protein product [Polarella glacialis]CAE8704945.1 unnamed protein product [Polarella glacialis]
MGPAPMVTIEEALDPADLQKVLKLIKDERSMVERWMDVRAKPLDHLDKMVQKLMAIDLQEVLPPAIAARVAGVSWRVNVYPPCEDHGFHFDTDEGLRNVIPGIPAIHPLLSTVTYLTSSGGPSVLFDYTWDDADNHDTLPKSGWISMPLKGKHTAFDPRLYHGVLGALRYTKNYTSSRSPDRPCKVDDDSLEELRIVLGLCFYETRAAETFEKDALPANEWPAPRGAPPQASGFRHQQRALSLPGASHQLCQQLHCFHLCSCS